MSMPKGQAAAVAISERTKTPSLLGSRSPQGLLKNPKPSAKFGSTKSGGGLMKSCKG